MKDLILLLSHLLAQHGWIKYVLEITLLTLGAGVVRVGTTRLFKRWTMHLNWKHKHFSGNRVYQDLAGAAAARVVYSLECCILS